MRTIKLSVIGFFLLVNSKTLLPASIDHWETIVMAGDNWKYYVAVSQGPPMSWREKGFDDSNWSSGPAGFGYADADDATTIVPCRSVFLRMSFTIADTAQIEALLLNIDFDDSFVVWINGIETDRSNVGIPGDIPAWNAAVLTSREAVMYHGGGPFSYCSNKRKLSGFLKNGTNLLCIQVNNSYDLPDDLSVIPFLFAGMKNPGITYRPVVSGWFYPPDMDWGSTLPLIIINTNAQTIPDEPKIPVYMGIIDNGPEKSNSPFDSYNKYAGMAGIELRGSSSQLFPKKPYGFETWSSVEVDTSVSLLGMPAESDWVLHGPYSDKSLIRNYMTYELFGRFGHYSPRCRFVELFLNNDYRGLYVLVEKIKRDSSRVHIAKLTDKDISGVALTGGYILKLDKSTGSASTEGFYSDFMPYVGSGPHFFMYDYPEGDELLEVQKNYIRRRVSNFETVLHGVGYNNPASGYRSYINVSSFVDYFIINEYSKNVDGFRLSTYLYKNRDDKDPLFYAGPVWDYDLAYGNANYVGAEYYYGWQHETDGGTWPNPFWWERLLTDPYFTGMLRCRWEELRTGMLHTDSINNYIDGLVEKIGDAAARNFSAFGVLGIYVWPNAFIGNTYQEEINYLKNWIASRADWLDKNLPGTCVATGHSESEKPSFLPVLFPNPSHDQVTLQIENPENSVLYLNIYDLTGRIVYTKTLSKTTEIVEKIRLPAGIYQVTVNDSIRHVSLKAIVN